MKIQEGVKTVAFSELKPGDAFRLPPVNSYNVRTSNHNEQQALNLATGLLWDADATTQVLPLPNATFNPGV